ncbi:transposase [Streptomyces osmaniensis]|uniref:Transposase n=1 Tax=Streptomyces osmaniensis TaxID=593134 RepID=A0ABP6ZAK7_9ACTN
MVMKSYSPEFKAGAVALYLSDPGLTLAAVVDDMGVSRGTLRDWVQAERSRQGELGTTVSTTRKARSGPR